MSGESSNLPPNPSTETPVDRSTPGEQPAAQPLRCSLTGEEISPEEAYWAPPIVTFGDLLRAITSNISRPALLKQMLLGEQENVPYSPAAREELAARRTTEQLKLLGFLLLILALIAGIIYLVAT
jgi:hypothetical protein